MHDLAIVIPYFKIKYFEECLASLAKQTNKNFSVYIGNDNSPEDPSGIIKEYGKDLNIEYRAFEYNVGSQSLVRQWERSIALSNNENWIMVLGDDDFIEENVVEEFYHQKSFVEDQGINVIRFATQIIWEEKGEKSEIFTHPKVEEATDSFYRKFFNSSRGSLSEHIFKKNVYEVYGFRDIPLAWGADDFAWFDFTQFGNIFTINSSVVSIRVSPESISYTKDNEDVKWEAHLQCFRIITESYLDKFKKQHRKPLLLYEEQIARKVGGISFEYWKMKCEIWFRERYYWEILLFSRRYFYYLTKI